MDFIFVNLTICKASLPRQIPKSINETWLIKFEINVRLSLVCFGIDGYPLRFSVSPLSGVSDHWPLLIELGRPQTDRP